MKALAQAIINFLLISFFVVIGFSNAKAQDDIYTETVEFLKSTGYRVSQEYTCNLAQGGYCYNVKTFSANLQYIIVACSEDGNVKDIDLYVNYSSGKLYIKDDKYDAFAIVTFTPSYTREMTVYVKNYSSNSYYSSRIKYVIAYK